MQRISSRIVPPVRDVEDDGKDATEHIEAARRRKSSATNHQHKRREHEHERERKHIHVPRTVGGRVKMGTEDRSTLADSDERRYTSSLLRFRTEVVREPGDDDTDGGVRPARDAKHSKVPRVRVGRHDQHDQVSDRTEETRTSDDETAGLETIGEVSSTAKDYRSDCVWRDGEELGDRIGCTDQPKACSPDTEKDSLYPKVVMIVGRNAEILARPELSPK